MQKDREVQKNLQTPGIWYETNKKLSNILEEAKKLFSHYFFN